MQLKADPAESLFLIHYVLKQEPAKRCEGELVLTRVRPGTYEMSLNFVQRLSGKECLDVAARYDFGRLALIMEPGEEVLSVNVLSASSGYLEAGGGMVREEYCERKPGVPMCGNKGSFASGS